MNAAEVLTIADLAKELGVSHATAKPLTEGLPVVMTVGRTNLYFRRDVKDALRERHQKVLNFLGVRPESESYDNVMTSDAKVSDEQE
jgi:hypothetical protein